MICRGCELKISGILRIVDLRVMDMSEFDVILGMDWLTAYRVVIECERRRVIAYTQEGTRVVFQGDKHDILPQMVYYSRCHGQLAGWLASLTLEDEVRPDLDLPQRMLFIDHILRSNMFPLQHIVQRRGAILEVLYRISEGYWFSPAELIMMSLFHFEDRVHRRSLPHAEFMPLLFPRLLCHILEHIGFPVEPRLERRRGCEATLAVDRWRARPYAFHLPPPVKPTNITLSLADR